MTTEELTSEKCIADEPPVPAPETLEFPGPDEILSESPSTSLLLEGFAPGEITANFLVDVHRVADEHGLSAEGISVCHSNPGQ